MPQALHSPRNADVPLLLLFPFVCMERKHCFYIVLHPFSSIHWKQFNYRKLHFFFFFLSHKLDETLHNYLTKFSSFRLHQFQEQKGLWEPNLFFHWAVNVISNLIQLFIVKGDSTEIVIVYLLIICNLLPSASTIY